METRFMPISLVKHKTTGKLYIVEYDYTYGYPSNRTRDFNSLALFKLNKKGEVTNVTSWHDINDFELISLPTQELFDKVTRFHIKITRK